MCVTGWRRLNVSLCEDSHCWKQGCRQRSVWPKQYSFLSFLFFFHFSEQLLDVPYTGRQEEKRQMVWQWENSLILALIKMRLEIHVRQRNYKLGIPGIKQDKQGPFSVVELHSDGFSFALEIYSFSFSSCKIWIKQMVVLMYSLNPVSNNIEQNIIWLQKVKYCYVQKEGFFHLHHSYNFLFCTFPILKCQKRNKNGCSPILWTLIEFMPIHLPCGYSSHWACATLGR